jgi:enterochelin esterase-like enzyme
VPNLDRGIVHVLGPFDVPGLKPDRSVRLYLPHRLRPKNRPLLVLFDGQNVFDDAPSFAGGWHAHEAVEALADRTAPPVVVGIDHGNEERIAELSPFPVQGNHGRLESLLAWMRTFLVPHLVAEHAVTTDPRKIAVGGSSMGGLAALYGHLAYPNTFGAALAMSPSIWVAGRALIGWAHHRELDPSGRVYLDAGGREGGGKMLRDARELEGLLRARGEGEVLFRADARGQHREADWRRRLPRALRFVFGPAQRTRKAA